MTYPPVPPSRARRLRLWWATTWWFQFAHAPLCRRFERDVIRLGRLRICRGCAMLYGGAALALGVAIRPGLSDGMTLALCYGLLTPTLALSDPPSYRRLPRRAKDAVRACFGSSLGLLIALGFGPYWWLALATCVGLYPAYRAFRRKRREVKAGECDGCPELGRDGVCSGYADQAESIRAFRDLLDEELNRPGVAPLAVLPGRTGCGPTG